MLKDNLTCDSRKCLICRIMFLLFLAFFALSPIADAYADSLFSPHFNLHGQNEQEDPVVTDKLNLKDDLSSNQKRKTSVNISRRNHTLLLASLKYEIACRIEKIQISAYDIKSSQMYPPVSSALPPPVI